MGNNDLRQVQFGVETTWGTPVAATGRLMGVLDANFMPEVTITPRRYLQADLAPAHKMFKTYELGKFNINGDVGTSELLYVLDSGIRGSVTPTSSGSVRTWSYPFHYTAVGNIRSRTLEIDDSVNEWEMEGGVVESFSLAGESGTDATITFNSAWIGERVTPGTLTPSLANRAFEILPAASGRIYFDAVGGTIGTTEIANSLISWSFDCTTGVTLQRAKGQTLLTPTGFRQGVPEVSLQLTLLYNASTHTEVQNYIAGTTRLIRVHCPGALITGSDYHHLRIDGAYVAASVDAIWGEFEGNTTATLTYNPIPDTGLGNYCRIELQNTTTALVG